MCYHSHYLLEVLGSGTFSSTQISEDFLVLVDTFGGNGGATMVWDDALRTKAYKFLQSMGSCTSLANILTEGRSPCPSNCFALVARRMIAWWTWAPHYGIMKWRVDRQSGCFCSRLGAERVLTKWVGGGGIVLCYLSHCEVRSRIRMGTWPH